MMASTFGLVLLLVPVLSPTTSMVDNASGQEVDIDTEEATIEEEKNNIGLVRQYLSAFDTGNVSNASQFISPQFVHTPGVPAHPAKAQIRGPEAFIYAVNSVREGFPDLRRGVQEIITQGDTVVAIINWTGTHTGDFFTLPPTGNKASWEVVHIFRIGEDGKIAEHRVIRDKLIFLIQLGVIGRTSVSPEHRPLLEALAGGITNSSR